MLFERSGLQVYGCDTGYYKLITTH